VPAGEGGTIGCSGVSTLPDGGVRNREEWWRQKGDGGIRHLENSMRAEPGTIIA